MKGAEVMTTIELNIILKLHTEWLQDFTQGERANLRNADLRNADLMNANLRNADLMNADLRYADLRNADLRYADLRNADLRYADLMNANLYNCIGDGNYIKTIQTNMYIVNYTATHMQIGCEYYTHKEWFNFSDAAIELMKSRALAWWVVWKPILKSIIEAEV